MCRLRASKPPNVLSQNRQTCSSLKKPEAQSTDARRGSAVFTSACSLYRDGVLTAEAKRRLVAALEASRRAEKEVQAQDRQREQEREARLATRLVEIRQHAHSGQT